MYLNASMCNKNMKSRNLAIILKFLFTSGYNDRSTPPDGHTYNRSFLFCIYTTHYSKNQKGLSVGRISHNPPPRNVA
jgi:hypothetical protein